MAVTAKQYLDYAGLSQYDSLIKSYIDTADAKAIKTVLWDGTNEYIRFYKKENATLADTPDYSIAMSSADIANLQARVGMSSTLNSYESQTNLTDILNVLTGNSSTTGSVAKIASDEADAAETAAKSYTDTSIAALDADLDASGTAQHSGTFVVSGVTEVDGVITAVDSVEVEAAGAAAAAVAALDVSEFALTSVANNVVTIKGIKEVDGQIAIGDGAGISLEEVAYTGDAEDVSYDNTTSGLTSTDVQAALDEVAAQSAGGVASKTVYITETAGSTSDLYSKRYGIYQGSTGSSSSPVVGEKLADIDIPKDMVVEDGSVVDVVFVEADSSLHEGSASGTDVTTEIKGSATATASDAGKYIKLVIANATSNHLWIKATDLVDIYTAQQNATQIQLAIDNNNVISATVVTGSIGTTELADDSVTAAKVSIAAHTETQTHTGGTTDDGLSISVTTTDGQVSAVSGSIAANTYDAYGAATEVYTAIQSIPSSSIQGLFTTT